METVITRNALLRFRSNTDEAIRITIPRARMDIQEAEAQATMQAMIDSGIVVTDSGRPASILGLEIVTTHRAPIV
jgi:hypothetical protein